MSNDIILVADYHDENTVIRQFDERTKEERLLKVPSTAKALSEVVDRARATLRRRRRGEVV